MRRYRLILLLVVALVGGAIALAITKSPTLGLDLQGGLEVVLEAQPPPGQEITNEDLDRSIQIMRSRVDKLGVAEPEIRKQGKNQIVIELAGVHDQARAADIIGKTARLEFYDLEADLVPPSVSQGFPVARNALYPLLKSIQKDAAKGTPSAWYLYGKDKRLLGGPESTKQAVLDELPDGKQPAGSEFLAVPGNRIVLTCSSDTATVCPGLNNPPVPGTTYYYLFKHQPTSAESPIPEMTGDDLKLRGTRQDFDQTNQPIVVMQFTNEGAQKFHDITRELAVRGKTQTQILASQNPLLQHFAIVLDDQIRSWPSIDFEQYPDGIAGDSAQITGLASVQEAKDLALVLQTGALPVSFEQVDRTDISATLGQDSLRQALIAAIGGLIAVAAFLLLFYRFLGLVAIAGLAIYGILLYGALLLFNVTLTLPGFAGLILTIGVAADANIVIFERIKEEVRNGRSVRAAITTGYQKGFKTIVDANVVTMITAFVLFAVATAGVKGFALMLLIGTAISMFTAVAATRALLGLLSGFRWFDNPAFMGASALKIPRWQRIDFIGRRRYWFAVSGAVVLICIGSLAWQGLNLGIDFKGGSQVAFKTEVPVTVDRVRQQASSIIPASAVVQGRGTETDGRYQSFQIRTESLTPAKQAELQRTLQNGLNVESYSIQNVSGSFSSQILRGAFLAIIASLLLIVVYITIRFQWKFAIPVLVALVHDIVITLGVYSLTQREMTTATIAAVLTILGYSIYDTIIIFDRIRENIPLMRRSSFAAIANQSLWETIRRSLATTFITLLPVISLLIFGGDTLKDFAFALLVGIVSGAYSTIFIATPLLATIKEREPEYAAKKGSNVPVEDLLDAGPEAAAVAATPVPARRSLSRRERRRATPEQPSPSGNGVAAQTVEPDAGVEPEEVVLPEAEPAYDEVAGETAALDEVDVDEVEAGPVDDDVQPARPADAAARREERRKRRRTRPHGRAR